MIILTLATVPRSIIRVLTLTRLKGKLIGIIGGILLVCLGFYHQPYYPVTWIDEGFALQGAMNLVRFGQYAMRSSEGFRVLDQPLIANGPGVVLPISAVFAIFGIGLLQARLLMMVYFLLTTLFFFTLTRRLYGLTSALISLFLILAVPQEGFLIYGRQALGNIPALGYFFAGYLLWLTALKREAWLYPVGAGVLFGLAMVTKGQYNLFIPAFLIVAVLDWVYYREIGLKKIGLMLLAIIVCLGVWYVAQLLLVGWDNFGQHLNAIRSSSNITIAAFRPSRILGNLGYLIRSGLVFVVGPGLFYVGWSCRKRSLASVGQILLVVFIMVWLFWYAFISVGWPRYAFDPYSIGLLFVGKLIVDAIRFVRSDRKTSLTHKRMESYIRLTITLLIGLIFIMGLSGFAQQIARINDESDQSVQIFADYLRNNIKPQAVIESWEWEVDVLADLTYHHPTNDWVDKYTAVLQFHEPLIEHYNVWVYQPSYLIDGPFSKWTGIYKAYLDEACCRHLFSVGSYDLYEVKQRQMD